MLSLNQASLIKEQYNDGTNLDARVALHARFSTAPRDFHHWVFDQFDLPDGARILELGGGTGLLWRKNRERINPTWRITLTDLSLGMLAGLDLTGFVKRPRSEAGRGGNLSGLSQCDAQVIPFPSNHFDAVIANHMLYHVPDLSRALAEIRRVLQHGGRLFAATNGANHMRELREFADAIGIDTSHFAELSFRLENGAELIAPHFVSVERYDFTDGLRVTEVEPLIAYIKSMRATMGHVNDEREQRLRAMASECLARDGAIRIRKETGLFVAKK